jgi:flavin-dependent dehydrogenase
VLSEAFRTAVADAGIPVEQRPVVDVRTDGDGVTVDGTRARYLVAADGLHSPLRRWAGLEGSPVSYRRFGQRVHFAQAPWTSYVEVHWADDAEAYVTPVGERLVGVAVLSSGRATFDEHLAGFPALRARLDGVERASKVRGAGPLRQRVTGRVAGRLLLVGDAAGYVDALTGEGVALALAQARAAVGAILAEDPARYEKEWHTVTRRYRLLTASLVGATRLRPVRRAIVPAADRLPRVFSAAVQSLAGPA